MRKLTWMTMIGLALLVVISGCASNLTEDEKYARDDRELLRLEAFGRYEASCNAQGGQVNIKRYTSVPRRCAWSSCPPARHDTVTCVGR